MQAMLYDGPVCGTEGPPVTYPSPCPPPGKPPLAPGICHPYPQPRPRPSCQHTTGCPDDCFTRVDTGPGIFPPSNPFAFETFPGTNFLPNVYTNMFDGAGHEIPNTLPSTPDVPYNLQDGDPVVSEINPTSPLDDLGRALHHRPGAGRPDRDAAGGARRRVAPAGFRGGGDRRRRRAR